MDMDSERLNRIEISLENINKKLDALLDLVNSQSPGLQRMDRHITSIETIYSIVKRPFSRFIASGLPDIALITNGSPE